MQRAVTVPPSASDPALYRVVVTHAQPIDSARPALPVNVSGYKRGLNYLSDGPDHGRFYESWSEPKKNKNGQLVRDGQGAAVLIRGFRYISPGISLDSRAAILRWEQDRRSNSLVRSDGSLASRGGRSVKSCGRRTKNITAEHCRTTPASSPGPSRPHGYKRGHFELQSSTGPSTPSITSDLDLDLFASSGELSASDVPNSSPCPKRRRERSPSIEIVSRPAPPFDLSSMHRILVMAVLEASIARVLSQQFKLLRQIDGNVMLSDLFYLDALVITERRPIVVVRNGVTSPVEEDDMLRWFAFGGKYLSTDGHKGKGRML
ncbi:hypothetical protein K488DRAFT_74524 [Vararia minispora EC-137]|uniref:Uncharacterized protein n=1 Tax=Vararia minispora EC-137 TaxID=1314806 RepID=A0ACB8Q6X1_9AGAM|nr:hypothetical protein K488DRAFT_74524 [Vararia minispora EC-137]